MIRHIEPGWESLARLWLHPKTGPAQREMMRQAFFGGAMHLFGTLSKSDFIPDTQDAGKLWDDIAVELDQFFLTFQLTNLRPEGTA